MKRWRFTYSGSGSSECQAEEQRQWADFLSGQDVGQRQTAVITAVPRMHRLENISQLQEVKTDNGRGQDRELQTETTQENSDKWSQQIKCSSKETLGVGMVSKSVDTFIAVTPEF